MQVEVLTDLDGLYSLRADWERLWQKLPEKSPFTSWDWAYHWCKAYSDVARPLLLVANQNSRVFGIAPLADRGRGRLCMLGSLECLPEYVSFLYDPGLAYEVLGTFFEFLRRCRKPKWRSLEINHAAAHGSLVRWVNEQAGGLASVRATARCWRLFLGNSLEETIQMQKKSTRRALRRALRQNEHLRVTTTSHGLDFATAWDALVTTHQARWAAVGEPGIFASPRMREFHRELARDWCARDCATIVVVWDGDRAVASGYVFLDDKAAYVYNGGMLPEYRPLATGTYCQLHECKIAIERGIRVLDLLSGDEPYKQDWKSEALPLVDLRVPGPGWSARLQHAFVTGWQTARSVLRDCSPRALRRAVRWLKRRGRFLRYRLTANPQIS